MSEQKKTRTTVDLYGQQYSIIGSESTSFIRLVASIVDDKMREIGEKNPSLDSTKLAVLTSVNVVHDYLKVRDELEALQNKLTSEKS